MAFRRPFLAGFIVVVIIFDAGINLNPYDIASSASRGMFLFGRKRANKPGAKQTAPQGQEIFSLTCSL